MAQVEVEAPDSATARDLLDDYFGSGGFGDLEVLSHEVLDEEELD